MMDTSTAMQLLHKKSEEARYIASLPYTNSEYIPWRRNTEDILEAAFGLISSEYRRIAEIKFPSGKMTKSQYQIAYKNVIHRIHLEINSVIQKYEVLGIAKSDTAGEQKKEIIDSKINDSKLIWHSIQIEFGITKRGFGRKINFISDPFKKSIIFRDVEQAYSLMKSGYFKPSVILAGSVIEELLRLYLEKNGISPQPPLNKDFNGYIQTCTQNGLLKNSVSRLSDSVRHFRNLVHLKAEKTKKHTISKSTAIGAVSSIFTVANDF